MKCLHCKKEIVLSPSAAERAKKLGGRPEDYTKLFEYHAECALGLRAAAVSALMVRSLT